MFKCNASRLKFLLVIFLLSTKSIFGCSRWLVSWFTVSVAFQLSDHSIGAEIYPLQAGNFSSISILKFRNLFIISLDVERVVSFVPACIMTWPGFFGVTKWYGDSNHQTSHQKNFQHLDHLQKASKAPLVMESLTINTVHFGNCLFAAVIFFLAVLLWTLFLNWY